MNTFNREVSSVTWKGGLKAMVQGIVMEWFLLDEFNLTLDEVKILNPHTVDHWRHVISESITCFMGKI